MATRARQTTSNTRSLLPSWGQVFETLMKVDAVFRQRQTLRDLDAHLLKDIGLDRQAADREAARPIWDVPSSWRR